MIIKSADYVISCVNKSQYPNSDKPEFVFIGRSNVGKSSFINALTNRKNLAYTSSKPGKTLCLNFYDINHEFYFVDVPGYGYASTFIGDRLDFGKMIEEYLNNSPLLKICFLIIDSRHKPTDDDILIYNYLKSLNKFIFVVGTKMDKLNQSELAKSKKEIFNSLPELTNDNFMLVSSISKTNIDKIWNKIETFLL